MAGQTASTITRERWVSDLRERLVAEGHDSRRVDELIASDLAAFDSARIRDFIPLLVTRSVREALRRR